MTFSADFKADHLVRVLAAARQEVAEPAAMLGNLGEALLRVNRERHDQGLAPDGTKWKDLAASTLAEGPRAGGTLKKTGRMLESFNYQVQSPALRLFFDGARDSKLAAIHHGGSAPYTISAKRAKALKIGNVFRKRVHHPGLPARPLVGFPASDQQLTGVVIKDHLTEVINRVR